MQKKIREFLKEYNRKYKASIILTSHYMGDVEALCKRIIIINYGSILFDGLLTDMVKKFAPYKQIRVILKNHVSRKRLQEFGEMREVNYPVVYYTIKQMEAQKTAGRILRDLPVEDLVIEEPEIEDVIRDVYERAKK